MWKNRIEKNTTDRLPCGTDSVYNPRPSSNSLFNKQPDTPDLLLQSTTVG